MREIDGLEVYGIEDVKIEEEAFCEHCYELEPFSAVVELGADYCIDCAKCSDEFIITKEEEKEIQIKETEAKIMHFESRLESLREYWASLILPKE
jgi:hypothetical protein